ncbi:MULTISPECIES: ABC transporter ATP-binding protein [Listeria]|uniref:ABC transporter ATP-binding protein n=1 Tax=Listeria TaxID=1637 RepID=UPI000B590C35|nr:MULTISPECIES: ABC transporter ATP-binding protein [Listeria]
MRKRRKTRTKRYHYHFPPDIAVQVDNVSKLFSLDQKKWYHFSLPFSKKEEVSYFQALEKISFEIKKGECIGLIGLNGSGKSTLASLIAGHLAPTNGTIRRNGAVSLLAINSGLKPNLTGIENIQLKLLLMDFKQAEIKKRMRQITEFAELHDFIHRPLKQYSSGMRAKLGFAIAIQTNPEILIIDEALSVGDQTFYQKCLKEIDRFKEDGKTIFFVSHAISQVKEISDRVAWLHYGQLKMFGESEETCLEYSKFIHHFNKKTQSERQKEQQTMMAEQKRNMKRKNDVQANTKIWHRIATFTILFIILIGSAWKIVTG